MAFRGEERGGEMVKEDGMAGVILIGERDEKRATIKYSASSSKNGIN